MNKIDLLYGFLIGIIATFIGSFLYITLVTDYPFMEGVQILKAQQQLGKIITLGAVLNIAAFFILLRLKKDIMARGVILATLVLTVVTLIV